MPRFINVELAARWQTIVIEAGEDWKTNEFALTVEFTIGFA
jgi:hypothetical protein